MSSSAHASTHEDRSTRSHARAHSYTLPLTSHTGSTREHRTDTSSSAHAQCTKPLWARTAKKPTLTRTSSCTRAPRSNSFACVDCTKPVDTHRIKSHSSAHEPYWFRAPAPYGAHAHLHTLYPMKPFLTHTNLCSRAVHARHTRAYSHFTAARGFLHK